MASRRSIVLALATSLLGACQSNKPKGKRGDSGSAERPASDPRLGWVDVLSEPEQPHSFATMYKGVRQHIDRRYTYDVVPPELEGGLLYQGTHRPPRGLRITLNLRKPARVFFFFHHQYDGGYAAIFPHLAGFRRHPDAPQYDLQGGDHGRRMLMFAAELEPGTYAIPPTTEARACFSIVFDFGEGSGG